MNSDQIGILPDHAPIATTIDIVTRRINLSDRCNDKHILNRDQVFKRLNPSKRNLNFLGKFEGVNVLNLIETHNMTTNIRILDTFKSTSLAHMHKEDN